MSAVNAQLGPQPPSTPVEGQHSVRASFLLLGLTGNSHQLTGPPGGPLESWVHGAGLRRGCPTRHAAGPGADRLAYGGSPYPVSCASQRQLSVVGAGLCSRRPILASETLWFHALRARWAAY